MKHYGKKVKLDGYTFDSQKEASFYAAYNQELRQKVRRASPVSANADL